MQILNPYTRDIFPKTDVEGGYIGDGAIACADMPERAFLRRGAKYVYRGWTQVCPDGEPGRMGAVWRGSCSEVGAPVRGQNADAQGVGFIDATPAGELSRLLCAPDAAGACQFPSEVALGINRIVTLENQLLNLIGNLV